MIVDTHSTARNPRQGACRPLGAIALAIAACLLVVWSGASRSAGRSAVAAPAHSASAAAAAPATVGLAPDYVAILAGQLYVSNCADDTVSVLNEATEATIATIPVGRCPSAIAVDAASNMVYVANSTDQTVSVIDAATDQVVGAPIQDFVQVDGSLAVDPGSNRIYVGDADGDTVTTIDGSTGYVFPGSIGVITAGNLVGGLSVDPTTQHVFVSNSGDGTVTDINMQTDVTAPPIPVGSEADLSALDTVLHRLYVVNSSANTVTMLVP